MILFYFLMTICRKNQWIDPDPVPDPYNEKPIMRIWTDPDLKCLAKWARTDPDMCSYTVGLQLELWPCGTINYQVYLRLQVEGTHRVAQPVSFRSAPGFICNSSSRFKYGVKILL